MKKAWVLLVLALGCIVLNAQTLAKNDALKFDADYYLMEKDFQKALNNYLIVIKSEPENADIKYRMGICYLNSEGEKEKAIPFLEDAVQNVSEKYNPGSFNETKAPIDAYFLLGSAYRVNNQLDKAFEAYSTYKSLLDPRDAYNQQVIEQYLRSCNTAREMQMKPVGLTSVNLGMPVNTDLPNFNAVLSGDGSILVYAQPARQGYDIFTSTLTNNAWSVPKNITTVLGTGKYMKTTDLSYDGLTLLLMLDDPMNADIFMSRFSKGKWSKAEPLSKEINGKSNETHASLSKDGQVLYFTSDRKGGEGDKDIYRSVTDSKGAWGKPENLGPVVNTPFNEETPFISDDGKRLYFSSEGHNGMGGYDIFYYDFDNPAKGAVNLGFPVNTTDNDLFYYPQNENGTTAYYAFKGSDSYGGRDIYQLMVEEPVEVITLSEPVEEPVAETIIEPAARAEVLPAEVPAAAEAELPAEVPAVVEEPLPLPVEEPLPVAAYVEEPVVTAETVDYAPTSESAGEAVTTNSLASPAVSYRVQIMALRKPVDLGQFSALQGLTVAYGSDNWYRYMTMHTTNWQEAEKSLAALTSKGYPDAFIRKSGIIPRFTIQVMAVPGPVVDLSRFKNLPEISVTRGTDHFCRYTTGAFESREEALANLERIRELGYAQAFVTAIKTQ